MCLRRRNMKKSMEEKMMIEAKTGNVLISALGELEVASVSGANPVRHVAELVEAENQGLVFRMPVAIGGTAWFFDPEDGPEPFECRVKGYYYLYGTELWYVNLQFVIKGIPTSTVEVPVEEFGICWFEDQADAIRSANSDEWRKDIQKAYISGMKAGLNRLSTRIVDRIETEFAACGEKKQRVAERIVDIVKDIHREEAGVE